MITGAKDMSEEDLARAFALIDDDNSGEISTQEMHECLSLLEDITDAEIHKMIALADEDGSGNIDFEEFVEACVHKNMLTQKQI